MTDMEAEAVRMIQDLWNMYPDELAIIRDKAHNAGMEEGRKSVKLECDEARKWGMEEAVKLVCKDCADGTKHNWIGCPAAAIREKINDRQK